MKLSDYIAKLEALKATHGDLDVVQHLPYQPMASFSRTVPLPKLRGVRKSKTREQYEKLCDLDDHEATGEVVFRL